MIDLSFIPQAIAATTTATAGGGADQLSTILLLGGFVAVFYFTMWRPQSKRNQEHRKLLNELKKGDEVVTSGGLVGRVNKITDNFVHLEIAENMQIVVQRPAITATLPKGTLKAA